MPRWSSFACPGCQQFTDSAYWAAATSVGGRHAATACGLLNTGGNVVGGVVAILVPITAERAGWPAALAHRLPLCPRRGAALARIRADRTAGRRLDTRADDPDS